MRGIRRTLLSLLIAFAAICSQAAASPSGQPIPRGDIRGWHQIFRDNFRRDVPLGGYPSHHDCGGRVYPASKWCPYPDGSHDTSGHGTYMPSKVMSNHGGILDLYLHTVNGVHRVAAPVPLLPASRGGHARGLRYGRFAVRFRAAQLHCYKTAWLLWPDSGVWPRDGEIDFPEGDLDSTIHGFVHYRNGTSGSDQYAMPDTGVTYRRWHTATIAWRPHYVRFRLDGRIVGRTRKRIPDKRMHWVLQTETGLGGCVPANSTAGHVKIDWVSVWKRKRKRS